MSSWYDVANALNSFVAIQTAQQRRKATQKTNGTTEEILLLGQKNDMKISDKEQIKEIVQKNKFRNYANTFFVGTNPETLKQTLTITLIEIGTATTIELNNDDIANACIDFFEKKILSEKSQGEE